MNKIVRMAAVLAVPLMMVPVQGCSVGMALSGAENPDLSAVRVGASRGEVEMHLGKPIKSIALGNGQSAEVYEYEIGNEPSGGRAVAHGVMDVLTLGLWELAGTPMEAVQGERYQTTITYGENDRVANINTERLGDN